LQCHFSDYSILGLADHARFLFLFKEDFDMDKLIITLAHTGNVPTKKMTEYVPVTPQEIAENIHRCASLGASVAHIHVRDEDGLPTCRRDRYQLVLEELDKRGTNIIKQLSTGARGGENTVADRGQMLDLNVEMASLSTGSSNFPGSINGNSPELIEALAKKMYENGIVPEIECFDLAMISNAQWLLKKGILTGPLHFNLVLGVKGSIEGTPRNLMYMVDSLPENCTWNVTAIGKSHMKLIPIAIAMGGNVRTGLEDVIELPDGNKVTNEELVSRIVKISESIGRDIADPEEARQILSLV